jgi:hypothetical protein
MRPSHGHVWLMQPEAIAPKLEEVDYVNTVCDISNMSDDLFQEIGIAESISDAISAVQNALKTNICINFDENWQLSRACCRILYYRESIGCVTFNLEYSQPDTCNANLHVGKGNISLFRRRTFY